MSFAGRCRGDPLYCVEKRAHVITRQAQEFFAKGCTPVSDLRSIKLPTPPSAPAREKTCWQCGKTFKTAREVCPEDGAKLLDLVLDGRDLLLGQTLDGRYEVKRGLAEGGMGKVYAAYDSERDVEVAIKVLKADYLRDETIRKRFMHEARIVANLSHPNVVDLYDFGQRPNGNFYMVMELLHGESLADRLAKKFLSYKEIFSIVPGICDALAEAHARGVVHRDLKPENIFIVTDEDGQDQAKLIDFGVARQAERQTLTQTGSLWGTPAYMSPEQCRGEQVSASGDTYAMGVILYELVCGHLPFSAGTQMGYAVKHMHSTPRAMKSAPGLHSPPDELDELVIRTLGKTPDVRPATMREFADELNAIITAHFTTAISLKSIPALEVDPEALKVWMDDGEPQADEAPSQSGQRLRSPSSPASFETEAVESSLFPDNAPTPPKRRPVALAVALVVLILSVSVIALAVHRRTDASTETEPVVATNLEVPTLDTSEPPEPSPVMLKVPEPVAESSAAAVGLGALVAAHVTIMSERMVVPAVEPKKKKSVRRSKSSRKRPRKPSKPKPQTTSSDDLKNALKKTF